MRHLQINQPQEIQNHTNIFLVKLFLTCPKLSHNLYVSNFKRKSMWDLIHLHKLIHLFFNLWISEYPDDPLLPSASKLYIEFACYISRTLIILGLTQTREDPGFWTTPL